MIDISKILPHRYPFLLIDKIIHLTPGKQITAQKNITFNEHFFQGHFPQEPIMPGVLIIEALAQAGACAILSMDENKGKIAYLAAIDKAKFKSKAVPGDVLILDVSIITLKSRAGTGLAVAKCNDKTVAQANITFMLNN